MFKQIIAMWKGGGLMSTVVEEFGEMLADAEYVFTTAWSALVGEVSLADVKQPIHDRDVAVNAREREIRSKLLQHLTINPGEDLSGCLVMMSLVKDAERIGDYAKNIFDLSEMMDGADHGMKYMGQLSSIQGRLAGHFPQLRRAFLESSAELAQDILNDYGPLKTDCSNILKNLFSEELPTREAVATALLSRHLKRVNSHMSNIASGLVYPMDQIDFVRGSIGE